jgi:Tfp pilus assembly protein PilN
MKIRLNLATTPLESNRSFIAGAALVGVLGVLAMLVLSWHAYSVWRTNAELRAEQAKIQTDMNRLETERAGIQEFFSQDSTIQQEDRAAFLNSLIAQRAFPWTKIFMDLERNLPVGVRVVSIEPRLVGDHLELRFNVGAADDDSKLKFLKALESAPEFSQIQVFSEARSDRPGDSDRIVLSLLARYSAI